MGFLQSPDPARKLARQYGVRGLFSPELVPSIQPVVLLDDLTGGITNEPQRICVATFFTTGVLAEFTVHRFECPPRVIALIEEVYLNSESSGIVEVFFGSSVAAPVAVATGAITDGRLRSVGQTPACILGGDTYAAKSATFHQIYPTNGSLTDPFVFKPNWVLGRTDGNNFDFVELANRTADQNVTCSIRWREYDAVEVR